MASTSRRLAALERRVASLERRGHRPRAAPAPRRGLEQLEELRRRRGPRYVRGRMRGAVVYAGAVACEGREGRWIREHGLSELLDREPGGLARVAAALGNPARLGLIRALIEAPRSGQELQQVLGTPSAGQLYHHLKELMAAGIVHQAGRGRYEVEPERTIPLLALLAAAADLVPGEPSSGEGSDENDGS